MELNNKYYWWWKSKLPDRRWTDCAVIARGRMNSILVEFEDGYRVVTSRYAVRKRKNVVAIEYSLGG